MICPSAAEAHALHGGGKHPTAERSQCDVQIQKNFDIGLQFANSEANSLRVRTAPSPAAICHTVQAHRPTPYRAAAGTNGPRRSARVAQ
jgi:hypothetical protein